MDTIEGIVQQFSAVFSAPSFENAIFLMLAWIKTDARARISNLLRVRRYLPDWVPTGQDGWKHFSVFYRFFTRAQWSLDELGRQVCRLFHWIISEDKKVVLIVDDTVQQRGGPRILGAGMHRNEEASSSGRKRIDFGLNFVVLAVWIPVECMEVEGIAIPILFRLYRSKKYCPESSYRKRTQLALDMLLVAAAWFPERSLTVAVDNEYSCKTVLRTRPDETDIIGRFRKDAVLYNPDFEQKPKGRSRKWGPRLGSVVEIANNPEMPWTKCNVQLYGTKVELQIKCFQAQWKSAKAETTLTVIMTRDPKGVYEDAYFFSTDSKASVQQILSGVSRRWSIEACFRDCKQLMRISSVQNGFAQGDKPKDTNEPGPDRPSGRKPTASRRTTPFGMLCYGVVVAWYLRHGQPEADLKRAKLHAPWYRQKSGISFRDMLGAFRRQMEIEGFWQTPSEMAFGENNRPESRGETKDRETTGANPDTTDPGIQKNAA